MGKRVGKCLLADLLKKADMSQQELAEKLNVPKQQINKYVNDKRYMSIKTARDIASILGCSIDDLYDWAGDNKEVGKNE